MPLSSDPHAWLLAIFAPLYRHNTFGLLSPSHQFEQLRQAVAAEHPQKAEAMREWSTTAQHFLLLHLASRVQQGMTANAIDLWHARKGDRELRLAVVYLPHGIDVRLLEADGFRRTQLCRDAPAVDALAAQWRAGLEQRGWQVSNDANA